MSKTTFQTGLGLVITVMVFLAGTGCNLLLPLDFPGPREGQVVDAATGRPIARASIEAAWECWDNPLPDGPGQFFVRTVAVTGDDGRFKLEKPKGRRGAFGCSYHVEFSAGGYIKAVYIYDPHNLPLPESTRKYPFVNTSVHASLSRTITVRLAPALPVLIEALAGDNPSYQRQAGEMLRELGPDALPALPALIQALGSDDQNVRIEAARAIGALGPDAVEAVAVLVEALKDPEADVREAAARALAGIGPPAEPATPALLAALGDDDEDVRKAAAIALAKIGPAARPGLMEAAESEDPHTRKSAREGLKKMEYEKTAEPTGSHEYFGTAERELTMAGDRGDRRIAEVLIQSGARLNAQDGQGKSALMAAAEAGKAEIVQMLLDHGANPDLRDQYGNTALILAARKGHREVVQSLLVAGADPNIQSVFGWTALMRAADDENIANVKMILEHGGRPDQENIDGWTALILAADRGNNRIVSLLLEHGADPNYRSSKDVTAIKQASRSNHSSTALLLLTHGARVEDGKLLEWAQRKGYDDIVEFLEKNPGP